jgi:ribulose-phosphate 3-epimerase
MAKLAVAINADNPADYATRIDRVKAFAKRIHVDISDGVFTPHKTPGLSQVYGIDGTELDLHLMVQYPESQYENALAVEPSLVICHFESDGDIALLLSRFREVGVKAGLAIRQETTVEQVKDLLPSIDHLLVFTGQLGFNGGEFDASVLDKIATAKAINGQLEVAVDGGVDQTSAPLAITAGVDVLAVGSFIQDAPDPEAAYIGLEAIAQGDNLQ